MLVLKALAPSLMALGSIILAIRVKRILDALVLAVISGSDEHARRCQRVGTGLLVAGFLLIAAGAILSGVVFYLAGI